MASDRAYEMLWDCGHCGAAKLLAKSQRFCPQCGAPQDTQARYFPDAADQVEAVGHRYEGADKICAACQSPNGALAEFCARCGAPLNDAAPVQTLADQVRAEDGKFAASLSLRQREAERRRNPAPARPAPTPRNHTRWMLAGVLALLGLLAVIVFWTRDESVTVTGHHWRQAIQVEQYGPVSESAWCGQMPATAYMVSHHREVREQRQVPDGQDCQMRRVDRGDGTFTEHQECRTKYRSEPVYDDRCDYRVDRWALERTAEAEGDDLAPRWPATGVAGSGAACLGCEREGRREAEYQVLFQNPAGKEYRCELPLERWRGIEKASRWTLKVGAVDRQPRCDSLKPAN